MPFSTPRDLELTPCNGGTQTGRSRYELHVTACPSIFVGGGSGVWNELSRLLLPPVFYQVSRAPSKSAFVRTLTSTPGTDSRCPGRCKKSWWIQGTKRYIYLREWLIRIWHMVNIGKCRYLENKEESTIHLRQLDCCFLGVSSWWKSTAMAVFQEPCWPTNVMTWLISRREKSRGRLNFRDPVNNLNAQVTVSLRECNHKLCSWDTPLNYWKLRAGTIQKEVFQRCCSFSKGWCAGSALPVFMGFEGTQCWPTFWGNFDLFGCRVVWFFHGFQAFYFVNYYVTSKYT